MIDLAALQEAAVFAFATPHDPFALRRAALIAEHALENAGSWFMRRGCGNDRTDFTVAGTIYGRGDEFIAELSRRRGRVRLFIDSLGGCGKTALQVARYLSGIDSEAIILNASSAAAILAAGCRRVGIVHTGRMMIHGPKVFAYGGPEELRAQAAALEAGSLNAVRELFKRRSKSEDVDRWLAEGDDHHRFDAAGAVAAGLADYIVADVVADSSPAPAGAQPCPGLPCVDPIDRLALTLGRALRVLPVQDRAALSQILAPLVGGSDGREGSALVPSRSE